MELVKLKMRYRYKISLIIIAILIILLATLGIYSFFFDGTLFDGSDIEANEDLSVYYKNGKNINIEESSDLEFSITSSGDKVSYFSMIFESVKGNGKYILSSDDNVISEGDLKSSNIVTISDMSIDAGVTKNYLLRIDTKDKLTATMNLKKEKNKVKIFADTILENSNVSNDPITEAGNETSKTDEGLIKTFDDSGVTYYFRGSVNNNYVKIDDMLFRIIRINGDGTVRLILDGTTSELSTYYSNTTDFTYNSSDIKSHLEKWLEENLSKYKDHLAITKYCNDIVADENYHFNSELRIYTNKIPTLNCLGTSFNSNVGLITVDEVVLAGANPTESNQSYYLFNDSIENSWYTLTGAKGTQDSINLFMVNPDGSLNYNVVGNLYRDVRPVINLTKDTSVTGKGTIDSPYEIVS